MTDRTYRRAVSPRFTDSIPIISHLHDIGRTVFILYCKCTGKEDKLSSTSKARQWYHTHRASKQWTFADDAYIMTAIAVAKYTPIKYMYNRKAKRVLRKVIRRCFAGDDTPLCLEACKEADCDETKVLDPWRIYKRSTDPVDSNHELFMYVYDNRGKFVQAANDLYQEFWLKYRECLSCPCHVLGIILTIAPIRW